MFEAHVKFGGGEGGWQQDGPPVFELSGATRTEWLATYLLFTDWALLLPECFPFSYRDAFVFIILFSFDSWYDSTRNVLNVPHGPAGRRGWGRLTGLGGGEETANGVALSLYVSLRLCSHFTGSRLFIPVLYEPQSRWMPNLLQNRIYDLNRGCHITFFAVRYGYVSN